MKLSTFLSIVVMGTVLLSPATEARNWLSSDAEATVSGGDSSSFAPTYLGQSRTQSEIDTGMLSEDLGSTLDRLSATKAEIADYAALEHDWDGEGGKPPSSANLRDSFAFLAALPGGFPVPTPMLGSSGKIELYWDIGHSYADISFEGDHHISLFTRNRSTKVEKYLADASLGELNAAWFNEHLGLLKNA